MLRAGKQRGDLKSKRTRDLWAAQRAETTTLPCAEKGRTEGCETEKLTADAAAAWVHVQFSFPRARSKWNTQIVPETHKTKRVDSRLLGVFLKKPSRNNHDCGFWELTTNWIDVRNEIAPKFCCRRRRVFVLRAIVFFEIEIQFDRSAAGRPTAVFARKLEVSGRPGQS